MPLGAVPPRMSRCGFSRVCVCRAPGDARLGWTSSRGSYVPLGAVQADGGPVPRTLVVVRRRLQVRVS